MNPDDPEAVLERNSRWGSIASVLAEFRLVIIAGTIATLAPLASVGAIHLGWPEPVAHAVFVFPALGLLLYLVNRVVRNYGNLL